MHVGGTIKITGGNRHPVADQMLIDNVDLSDATIVDIGAADGSTSLDLIGKLAAFQRYVIADLHFSSHGGRHRSALLVLRRRRDADPRQMDAAQPSHNQFCYSVRGRSPRS